MKMRLSIVILLSLYVSVEAFAPSTVNKPRLASGLSYSSYPFNTYSLVEAESTMSSGTATLEENQFDVDAQEPSRYQPESRMAGGVAPLGVDSYIASNRTFRPSSWRHGSSSRSGSLFDEMNQVSKMEVFEELPEAKARTARTYLVSNRPAPIDTPEPIIIEERPPTVSEAASAATNTASADMTLAAQPKVTAPSVVQEQKKDEPKPVVPENVYRPVTKPSPKSKEETAKHIPVRTLTPLEKKYASEQVLRKLESIKPKAAKPATQKPAMTRNLPDTRPGKHLPFRTLTPLEKKYPASLAKETKPRIRVVAQPPKKTFPSRTLTPLEKRYASV